MNNLTPPLWILALPAVAPVQTPVALLPASDWQRRDKRAMRALLLPSGRSNSSHVSPIVSPSGRRRPSTFSRARPPQTLGINFLSSSNGRGGAIVGGARVRNRVVLSGGFRRSHADVRLGSRPRPAVQPRNPTKGPRRRTRRA